MTSSKKRIKNKLLDKLLLKLSKTDKNILLIAPNQQIIFNSLKNSTDKYFVHKTYSLKLLEETYTLQHYVGIDNNKGCLNKPDQKNILNSIAHELNNPIAGMKTFLQISSEETENVFIKSQISKMLNVTNECQQIIDLLLGPKSVLTSSLKEIDDSLTSRQKSLDKN